MKCELCHEREAETAIFREGKGKRREELYVCRACAEREQAFGHERGIQVAAMEMGDAPGPNPGLPPGGMEMLGGAPREILGKALGMISAALEAEDGETRCPDCGMTLEEVREQERMGCPRCYTYFHEAILPMLSEIQRCTVYGGAAQVKGGRQAEISALEAALKAAVAREDYGEAKRLQAQLRKLREEQEGEAHA